MTQFPAMISRRHKAFNETTAEPAISRPYLLRYFSAAVVAAEGRRNTADVCQHPRGGEHAEPRHQSGRAAL